jgi:diguanylate cyclase (GGDEF)-like protein
MKQLEHIPVTNELPSPKGVALAILKLCNSAEASHHDLARIAQLDPALTGRLIHQANSAAVSRHRPVASVVEAITRLGLTTVRNQALGFSQVDQYRNGPCQTFDYQSFWSHSLLMALAMQHFSLLTGAGSPDELFACGLMSRIGCLALATLYPVEYAQLLAARDDATPLAQREQELLHTNHNELTAALLLEWGLPSALAEPVYHHENPSDSGFAPGSRPYQLAHLFYLAKCVADLGIADETHRDDQTAQLLLLGSKIGLDADDLGHAVDQLVSQWHEWGALLKVPASALPSFAQMSGTAPQPAGSDGTAPRTLMVTDDSGTLDLLKAVLNNLFRLGTVCTARGHEACAMALETQPQVVIVDWMLPDMKGIELCHLLRETEWGRKIYLIMLTTSEADDEINAAFEAGANDVLSRPLNLGGLSAHLRAAWRYVQLLDAWEQDRHQLKQFAAELATSNRQLGHAAMTDLLTSLPNRRAGMDSLAMAWSAAERSGQPLSALVLDIDFFKDINDSHGHAAGDKALQDIAEALQRSVRKNESICRMGGEEFLMSCQNTDLKTAVQAAERLRNMVENLELTIGDAVIRTTVSIGVATREEGVADPDSLVKAADRALYLAKQTGRNRTCFSAQGKLHYGAR